MTLSKDPNALDSDLAALLPPTATPTERIYAVAVDDTRKAHDERLAAENARAEAAEAAAAERAVASLAEAKRHNEACEQLAAKQLAAIQESDPGFSKEDNLFIGCVKLGVETRKQSMSSSTGRDTVMRDVVNDGTWIGYQVYNRIAAELGLPARTVPADL